MIKLKDNKINYYNIFGADRSPRRGNVMFLSVFLWMCASSTLFKSWVLAAYKKASGYSGILILCWTSKQGGKDFKEDFKKDFKEYYKEDFKEDFQGDLKKHFFRIGGVQTMPCRSLIFGSKRTRWWLQDHFRMTSGWLQDDFRMTSGWLQDLTVGYEIWNRIWLQDWTSGYDFRIWLQDMTSVWLQDDFRMTSGWFRMNQDDFGMTTSAPIYLSGADNLFLPGTDSCFCRSETWMSRTRLRGSERIHQKDSVCLETLVLN